MRRTQCVLQVAYLADDLTVLVIVIKKLPIYPCSALVGRKCRSEKIDTLIYIKNSIYINSFIMNGGIILTGRITGLNCQLDLKFDSAHLYIYFIFITKVILFKFYKSIKAT